MKINRKGILVILTIISFTLLLSIDAHAQSVNNLDFESGSAKIGLTGKGWEIKKGENKNSTTMEGCCTETAVQGVGGLASYQIINRGEKDPNIPSFNAYPPNSGNYNIRLGVADIMSDDNFAFRASNTFKVDSSRALLVVYYAVTLGGSSLHKCDDQPYFNMEVKTKAGFVLPCSQNKIVVENKDCSATGTMDGFTNYVITKPPLANFPEKEFYISNSGWRKATLDLRAYINQEVTLEITTASCTKNGHRGYVYFDADCIPFELGVDGATRIVPGTVAVMDAGNVGLKGCSNDAPKVTLQAQDGFASYKWEGPGVNLDVASHEALQTIKTNVPGEYKLTMVPFVPGTLDASCTRTEMKIKIDSALQSPQAVLSGTDAICFNKPTPAFKDKSDGLGTLIQSRTWFIDNVPVVSGVSGDSMQFPYTAPGNYTIKLSVVNNLGCSSSVVKNYSIKSLPPKPQVTDGNICQGTSPTAIGTNLKWYDAFNNPLIGTPVVQTLTTPVRFYVSQTVNGCEGDTAGVKLDVLPQPVITSVLVTDNKCNKEQHGAITVTVQNQLPSFEFLWSNGSNARDINNLAAGSYKLTITNDKGCKTDTTAKVSEPAKLLTHPKITHVNCKGENNGSVELDMAGGILPYRFEWSNDLANTSKYNKNLFAGKYLVTVCDSNNCRVDTFVVVNDGIKPIAPVVEDIKKCSGTGVISPIIASGMHYWYDESMNRLTSVPVVNKQQSGKHIFHVTNVTINGCESDPEKVEINIVESPTIALVNKKDPDCLGYLKGEVTVTATGGLRRYVFSLTDVAGRQDSGWFTKVDPGRYYAQVRDANGCTDRLPVDIVMVQDDCDFLMPTGFSPNGDGLNDVFRPARYGIISDFRMQIFNRWGIMMYEGADPKQGWNGLYKGVNQPPGTYIWSVKYRNKNNEIREFKGNVILIR